MLSSFRISSPVSRSVPANVATSASVRVAVGGACGGNRRVHAVNTRLDSLQQAISAIPVVVTVQAQAHLKNVFDFADRSYAAIGVRMPTYSDGNRVNAGFQQLFVKSSQSAACAGLVV